MLRNKLKIIVCILFYTTVSAQEPILLNYENYIKNVLQNHPVSKRANNTAELGKLQYQAARGNYDPLLKSNYENKTTETVNYYTIGNAELKQALYTSQYLKMGYDYGQGININPERLTKPVGVPYLGVEVALLQGLVIDKSRAEVLKGKQYMQLNELEKKILLNNLLIESSVTYVDLLFSKQQSLLWSNFFKQAEDRLKGIGALAKAGERTVMDTIEASIILQSRLLEMKTVILEYKKLCAQILYFNEAPIVNETTFSNELVIQDSLEQCYTRVLKRIQGSILNEALLSNHPFIAQYQTKQHILEIDKKLRKELIKPKLDLSYNFLGNFKNELPANFTTNAYKMAVNFSFPLLTRNSRNELKSLKLQCENNLWDTKNKTSELLLKSNNLKVSISLTAEQIAVAEKTVLYYKQLVSAELLKFEIGESSLFMLNTRETKWIEAELKLMEYKQKLIKLYLNLIYINGDLNYVL